MRGILVPRLEPLDDLFSMFITPFVARPQLNLQYQPTSISTYGTASNKKGRHPSVPTASSVLLEFLSFHSAAAQQTAAHLLSHSIR